MVRQLLWRAAGEPDLFKVLAVDGPANMAMGASPDVKEGVFLKFAEGRLQSARLEACCWARILPVPL